MKKLTTLIFGLLIGMAVLAHAIDKVQRPQGSYIDVGQNMITYQVTCATFTPITTVSAFSQSRAHLYCHNASTSTIFISSSTAFGTTVGYQVEASSLPVSYFETYTSAAIFCETATSLNAVLSCYEER